MCDEDSLREKLVQAMHRNSDNGAGTPFGALPQCQRTALYARVDAVLPIVYEIVDELTSALERSERERDVAQSDLARVQRMNRDRDRELDELYNHSHLTERQLELLRRIACGKFEGWLITRVNDKLTVGGELIAKGFIEVGVHSNPRVTRTGHLVLHRADERSEQ